VVKFPTILFLQNLILQKNRLAASIVSEWSAAFELDNIMEMEKSLLETMPDNSESIADASIITSTGPFEPDVSLLNMNDENIDENISISNFTLKKSTGEIALAPIKERKDPIKKKRRSVSVLIEKEPESMQTVQEENKEEPLTFDTDFWSNPQSLLNNLQNNQ